MSIGFCNQSWFLWVGRDSRCWDPLVPLDVLVDVVLQHLSVGLHLPDEDPGAGPAPVGLLQLWPELVQVDDSLDLPLYPGWGAFPGWDDGGESLSVQAHGDTLSWPASWERLFVVIESCDRPTPSQDYPPVSLRMSTSFGGETLESLSSATGTSSGWWWEERSGKYGKPVFQSTTSTTILSIFPMLVLKFSKSQLLFVYFLRHA